MPSPRTVLCSLPALCLTFACTSPAPDLQRLYSFKTGADRQPPLVLVHGFMGAELSDGDGERLWPAARVGDALGLQIDAQTLEPLQQPVVASGLAHRAAGVSLDRQILDVLEAAGGYRRAEPGQPASGDRRYYVFLYDWRMDQVTSVRAFEHFLDRIRDDYADPELKVDIVAHGLGGLLVRYYLRYGTTDVLDNNRFELNYAGDARLNRIVLLGVPNLGAVAAVRLLTSGWPMPSGRPIEPEMALTWPSAYQAMPHPISGWVLDREGHSLGYDMFDIEIWRQLELGPFNTQLRERVAARYPTQAAADAYLATLERYFGKRLERARRFVWSLTVPAERLRDRLIVMGSACELTPARVLIEQIDGRSQLRLFPGDITRPAPGVDYERLMLEPGDGTITKSSLLARQALNPAVRRHMYSYFPLDYALFMCAPHDRLTSDVHFQNNLLNALLSNE